MGAFYRSKHELIFAFKQGTAPHTNSFGLGQTGRYRTNVWDYAGISSIGASRAEELAMHPTVKPVALIADMMRVSGSYLARVCTNLDVPRPERGYWAKLAVGKAPLQPALPEPSGRIQLTWSQTGEPVKMPKPKAPSPKAPNSKIAVPRDRVHPLIAGAAKHFESGRDVEQGSYLKPYKKMLVDITAAQPTLQAALDLANALFNAFEAAGRRVALAPYNARLRRLDVEEREPVGKPRAHWEYPYPGFWSPDRPTVVYVGTVAIGLQIVEMSETVTLRYVRGKYIRDSEYVPPSASDLPEIEQALVMQRLALARTFLGTQDPLDFFRSWKTPEERYSPRFPYS